MNFVFKVSMFEGKQLRVFHVLAVATQLRIKGMQFGGIAMIIAMAYTRVQPLTRLINCVGELTQDGCQACYPRCLFVYIITRYWFYM